MARFAKYGPRDTPWGVDGDVGFKGIDMIHDRAMLPPGYLARGENKRLREGPASTRLGTGFPADFNPVFENKILGSGIYSNPNGAEVMLVATLNATYVWALQHNKDPIKIDLDAGQNTGTNPLGLVQFIQAFDKVILLRFPVAGQMPLVWYGNNANSFDPITLISPGLKLVPTTLFGARHKNRVIFYSPYLASLPARDQLIISDVNNYSSYDEVYGDIRINSAESDVITSVKPYFKDSLVVFKKGSIHVLENFSIPLSLGIGSGNQRPISTAFGGTGVHPPLMVGRDIIFPSEPGGFYRITEQDIQEQIAPDQEPISRKIQPIIDQIDWGRMIWWGCSALLNNYAYFGITRKGQGGSGVVPGCDAILVYDTVDREWHSAPDWRDDPTFLINALHVTSYDGGRRLFGLDYANARIYVLDQGLEDEVNGDSKPVHDIMETRGYVNANPGGYKRFQRAVIGFRTFDPDAVVTAIFDGVNEEKQLAVVTKDRLKFYTHAHKDFDPNTDDPTEPRRQDYSPGEEVSNFAYQDFENLPEGLIDFLPATGLALTGDKQEALEPLVIRQNGRWCSIRIENTSGQCDVLGIEVDAIPSREGVKTLA